VEFFNRVIINMTLGTELEDKEDQEEEKHEDSPKGNDKTLTVLEALPAHIDWRQIFLLPEWMLQCVDATLRHLKLYADKVKDAKESSKCLGQHATYNTAITFTDNDLLLGSRPHNRPLFVTSYIREKKSSVSS